MRTLQKRALSFKNAFKGLWSLVRDEPNARIHLIAALCTIGLGIYFRIEPQEWMAITLCTGIVIGLEGANAAIEELADHSSSEMNERIRRVKDLSAGAVLIAAIASLVVAGLIFLPYFF